jgi:hypothetical protein
MTAVRECVAGQCCQGLGGSGRAWVKVLGYGCEGRGPMCSMSCIGEGGRGPWFAKRLIGGASNRSSIKMGIYSSGEGDR